MRKPGRSGKLLFGAGVVGLLLLLVLLGRRLSVSYGTPLTGCLRDHGTGGGLGLARWASRLGYAVRGLEVPAWEAGGALARPAGNCLITMGDGPWSPTREDLDDQHWHALERWLIQGNALLLITTEPGTLPGPLRDNLLKVWFRQPVNEKRKSRFWQTAVASEPETRSVPGPDGSALTVAADGPRLLILDRAAAEGAPETWAKDEQGGVLFRVPYGSGAIYLLLDDFAWTNAGLDHGDNARVLATILTREVRGGVLALDEYRHGHGRSVSFLTYLLSLPGASHFAGIAFLWIAFYFYGCNIRLAPAEPSPVVERRTAREYLDAVAGLHERARAAPLVVEAVARRVRHLVGSLSEVPATTTELLEHAQRAIALGARPSRPVEAMALVAGLLRLRKDIHGPRAFS